jgi:hypothetical protein
MRQLSFLLVGMLWVAPLIACGSDAGSQRPDGGWTIDEDSGASEGPEGLPDEYVDHPIHERRFPSPTATVCDQAEQLFDGFTVDDKFHHPIIGEGLILGLRPLQYDPAPIEQYNYNLFIRLPRKSERWHRFEMRPSSLRGEETYRIAWTETENPHLYVYVSNLVVSLSLATPNCQIPTQGQMQRFVAEFSELEVIFHNPTNDKTYRFEPREPGATLIKDPSVVLYGTTPATLTWDLPLNRPQQPIPGFLRPR